MAGKPDSQINLAKIALREGRYQDTELHCAELIRQNPNNAVAITLLGETAWRNRSTKKAFDIFQKAHLIDKNLIDPIVGIAKTSAVINNINSAREYAERAINLRPRNSEHLFELGRVFNYLADFRRALGLFEQAVTASPKNIEYILFLGLSRQSNGDNEGAERALRRCLEINPQFSLAYFFLISMKKQTHDENFISILEELFSQETKDLDQHLAVGHALAKSYEDIDNPLAAMSVLERAKSRRRASVPYYRARTEELFEQATQTFPPSTLFGKPNASDTPIFIFGMPRSGTTLTDRILSSHPFVTSVGETLCFPTLTRTSVSLSRSRLDDPEILRRSSSIDAGQLGDAYLKEISALMEPNRRFVDKFPYNFLFAGLIHQALPNARLICLRRDPVDVCLSNYRLLFNSKSVFSGHIYSLDDLGHYYLLFDQLMTHWGATLPPDRFMSLQYESLVANQEMETRRLLEFCGLPWDERCLAFHEHNVSISTPSLHQVRQPMFTTSIGRWRRYGDSLKPLIDVLKEGGLLDEATEAS